MAVGAGVLDVLADAELATAHELAVASIAESTRAAYASDLRQFEAWCAERRLPALPASPATLCRYLADARAVLAPSTIRRRLVSIGVAHKAAGLANPTVDEAVVRVWRGVQRERGLAPRKVRAMRDDLLLAVVAPLDLARAPDARDRALLVLGRTGALRRSELVAIDVEHVTEDEQGLRLWLPRSKRDQAGEGALVGLPIGAHEQTCPVRAWRSWLAASGVTQGPAFRGVDRHGNVAEGRLSDRQVARVVQRRAKAAGLDGAAFGGHSLRAGFATEAYSRGRAELGIMRHGRWRSASAMRGYVEDGGLWIDNAAEGL